VRKIRWRKAAIPVSMQTKIDPKTMLLPYIAGELLLFNEKLTFICTKSNRRLAKIKILKIVVTKKNQFSTIQ
jgi:hypothetical protein